MSSTDDERLFTEEDGGGTFGKWVSLTCVGGDRIDIDCGRVRCDFSPVEYMATVHGDAIVIVPSAFRCVSQMVTVAVLSSRDRNVGGGPIDIAVRRQSIRCRCPYRFAYVDGLHYEVMGVSKAFTFHHGNGRPCDCDDGFSKEPPTTAALSNRPDEQVVGTNSSISSPTDAVRFNEAESQCLVCRIPSNHRIVLEHLKKNINHLSDIELTIDKEYMKQTECLENCTVLLEYQMVKTKMLSQEIIKYQQFLDGLIWNLLENHKATFRMGKNTIFTKINTTHKGGNTAVESFMDSIINSQNQVIANLTTKHKEVLTMINTLTLFS